MSPPNPSSGDDLAALRGFLAARDEACPSCAYNLRGLESDRCPECNEALARRVNLAEPRQALWIAALAGLLAVGGAALVCLMLALYMSIRHGFPNKYFALLIYPAIIAAGETVLVTRLASMRGRRWFRNLSRVGRRRVVGAAWASLVAAVAGFLVMVEYHILVSRTIRALVLRVKTSRGPDNRPMKVVYAACFHRPRTRPA